MHHEPMDSMLDSLGSSCPKTLNWESLQNDNIHLFLNVNALRDRDLEHSTQQA